MAQRTYLWPDLHLGVFSGVCLVVCPHCRAAAEVGQRAGRHWFRCSKCPITRDDAKRLQGLTYGAPVDPYFRLPLYLQKDFRGKVFWAYHWAHLSFLEDAIGAELRPGAPPGKRRLRNKLPKWMLQAKNREDLLRVIRKMRSEFSRGR